MLTAETVRSYLERLGADAPGTPSAEALAALHRAHVERVPYETLEIHLGRRTSVDPRESAARILRGRGGYCFHLNGAFAALLAALGYAVTWHRAGVHGDATVPAPGANANHLALTVACEGEEWLVDVGLGDALHEPLPLRAGDHRQGPFTYRVRPSAAEPGGWRFDHDPRGSFAGMDFAPEPAGPEDFAAQHERLSTSPESGFVRVVSVARRDAAGVDKVSGCLLTRTDARGRTAVELTTAAEWFDALADVFGLALADVGPRERRALWRRVRTSHEAWAATPEGRSVLPAAGGAPVARA